MDSIDRLAKKLADLHKDNRNPPSLAPRKGHVVQSSPLKIQWGDKVLLTEEKLILPKLYREGMMIPNRYKNNVGDMVEETLLWKPELAIGQEVLLMPDDQLRSWYVIDIIS